MKQWHNVLEGDGYLYLKKSFNKRKNKTQLSFVQEYRIDGKVKHKVIKNLGYLEDYLYKYEDPVAYFQQIAKKWNEMQETPESIHRNSKKTFTSELPALLAEIPKKPIIMMSRTSTLKPTLSSLTKK